MPELPEVETVCRQLAREIEGATIKNTIIRYSGKLNASPVDFAHAVNGAQITNIKRRAKIIIITLGNGMSLLVHLKMSGRLLVKTPNEVATKHTHVIFQLNNNKELHFEDTRKFGYTHIYSTDDIQNIPTIKNLGPEPLEASFTVQDFINQLHTFPKRRIKQSLLDQHIIAGVGNIYADESCHMARIHPEAIISTIPTENLHNLFSSLQTILNASIDRHGTSSDMFVDAYGNRGDNVRFLQVYGREGESCRTCADTITKSRVAGRGTHICPSCQTI
jgi:formamidopyrimidine-DNA glycosylase